MSKQVFFLSILLLIGFSSFSQSKENKPNYIHNQVNINAYMDYYGSNMRSFGLGGGYGINKWIEAGVYCGFMTQNVVNDRMSIVNCGIGAKAHIVNIFAPHFYAVDPYIVARIGVRSVSGNDSSFTKFNYNAGGGLSVNFSRHFGLFYELYYDNIMHNSVNRFGLNIRFGGKKQ